jgi:hypothetical protein
VSYRYEIKTLPSPLIIEAQAYCTNDESNQFVTWIRYDYRFKNTSTVFDITQVVASVYIPLYEKILASDYVSTEGTNQKSHNLKVTVTNGSRHFSITCSKIKPETEIAFSISIKVLTDSLTDSLTD